MVAIETILQRTMICYTIVQKSAGPYEQAAAAGNWDPDKKADCGIFQTIFVARLQHALTC